MNVVCVTINGIQLKIKGVEDSEYIYKVARIVETLYNRLHDNNSKLSIHELYVLTALNAVDEMLKSRAELKDVEVERDCLLQEYLELKSKLKKFELKENNKSENNKN